MAKHERSAKNEGVQTGKIKLASAIQLESEVRRQRVLVNLYETRVNQCTKMSEMSKKTNLFRTIAILLIAHSRLWAAGTLQAQDVWEPQTSGSPASLRGISAANVQTCWASGSAGTVLRTTDGGETWSSVSPPHTGDQDFRDIEAFDDQTAVIMSAGEIDRVYRTENGGQTWAMTYEHPDGKAFFDGMAFGDELHGWIMSDPIDGRLLILKTVDGGKSWQPLPREQSPAVESGEAGFAASGTNLLAIGKHELMIALGGSDPDSNSVASRMVATQDGGKTWEFHSVPIARNPSSGMFSIARADQKHWVAVGGNYKRADESSENFVTSSDGGQTWKKPVGLAPSGYRSVVAVGKHSSSKFLLAAGPSGTDLSNDFGQTWRRVSDTGFHTVDFSADLSAGWGAGSDGRISKWIGLPDK